MTTNNFFKNSSIAVIMDDHALFTEGFATQLDALGIFRKVYAYSTASDLIDFFIKKRSTDFTYLFIDYYLNEGDCIPLIKQIRGLTKQLQITVISSLLNPVLIQELMLYNISGFVSKIAGMAEVLDCLKTIESGGYYISPNIKALLEANDNFTPVFTQREKELLKYFEKGYSLQEAAQTFYLSINTVIAHRRNMMKKTNTKSIGSLIAFARKAGLI
ncbi:MAG: response regulator transcription factor [Taibaiella sp.]|nr:response regulator transcription factor [Taibaiella sp.]